VARLQSARPERRAIVERLLVKRAEGDAEVQRQIDETLLGLARPNYFVWLLSLALLGVLALVGFDWYQSVQRKAAFASGRQVKAHVERMTEGWCLTGGRDEQCTTLELSIHPDGAAPFSATLTQQIPIRYLPRVQAGEWLVVALDPSHEGRVILDPDSLGAPPPPER